MPPPANSCSAKGSWAMSSRRLRRRGCRLWGAGIRGPVERRAVQRFAAISALAVTVRASLGPEEPSIDHATCEGLRFPVHYTTEQSHLVRNPHAVCPPHEGDREGCPIYGRPATTSRDSKASASPCLLAGERGPRPYDDMMILFRYCASSPMNGYRFPLPLSFLPYWYETGWFTYRCAVKIPNQRA